MQYRGASGFGRGPGLRTVAGPANCSTILLHAENKRAEIDLQKVPITYRPRLEPRVENRTELPLVSENIARRIVYSLRQKRGDLDPKFGQRNGRTD